MSGVDGGSSNTPATNASEESTVLFASANDPQALFDSDTSSESIAVTANPDNSDTVFVSFIDEMTTDEGTPLEPGATFSADVDVFAAPIYGIAESAGDEVRIVALE